MPKRRRRSLIGAGGRAALWLVVATGLAMAFVLVAPHNLGLWDKYPIVQLEALQLGWIIALFLLICMVAVALWHSRHQKDALRRTLQVVAFLMIAVALTEFVLFTRAGGAMPAHLATVPAEEKDITVLSFNAFNSDADEIVEAAEATEANVLLLVEVEPKVAAQVAELWRMQGTSNQLFSGSDTHDVDTDGTAIITSDQLGRYRQVPGPALTLGSVSVAPVGESAIRSGDSAFTPPRLSVVHPPPPVPDKYSSTTWRRQLDLAVQTCRPGEGTIVGGDFNASTAHVSLLADQSCHDAGKYLGRGAVGTWPTSVPAPLGASIDHQIIDTRHWEPVGIRFVDIGESDHRALAVSYRNVDT